MNKILLIDNHDSFVHNLKHSVLNSWNSDLVIMKNDDPDLLLNSSWAGIIISPGPGLPSEAGFLMEVMRKYEDKTPILGICLGHQAIAEMYGAKLEQQLVLSHGIQSTIKLNPKELLWHNIKSTIEVGRYHSWIVSKNNLPLELEIIAEDSSDVIMAFKHKTKSIVGIQFHPESYLTPNGNRIISNYLKYYIKFKNIQMEHRF